MLQQDVERLVEQVALRLGWGLSLEDLDGLLLAYSSNQSHADRVRVNFLLSKRVAADVSAWQLSHGIATAVRPVAIPANPELGMLGRVCVPLTVRGFRVGYLWVQQEQGEESPAAILRALHSEQGDIAALAAMLLESNTVESGFRRSREREFLAACMGDANAISAVAGWREVQGKGPWHVVTVLQADGLAGGEDPAAARLIHSSAALQATVGVDAALFSGGTETHSVVLFRASPGRAVHAQVLVHYQLELAKRSGRPVHRIILGLSEGFERPRELAEAYAESKVAAQAAAVDSQLGELVDCRSTGVYQVLASAGGGAGAWAEASSTYYRLLLDHDRAGELLPVLELLYDNDGAVQDVATALHLHRSSIYNRLARVRKIIGVDPLKGAARLELHSAMKARRWAGRPRI
ncbi:PucR family transcriptional regulator [Pseudarthrobacter sp. PS3-L1]|uniref:PucR family transcriptional regulator n=1 Tax=Pseudarthrobacter sp. PS3-L1 TaxID=3046207 RepID=UPI0024B9BE73|nr:PucR family transcriptional regulator [Pseudarthrobacter sp. PS3-L1]MDJ0321059.1 helix-turn-helix domain-containing protein [Pseudarthrobacter sp. PS3-L1]